jgi:hypothetical protein
MPTTLALVPSTPTAISRRPTPNYITNALTSPIVITIAVLATLLGASVAGGLGTLVAVGVVTTGTVISARTARMRAHLDRLARQRLRNAREHERLRMLEATGSVRKAQYLDLRQLVEGLERDTPADADRFELQDMLDYFIRVSVAHHRCIDALRLAGTAETDLSSCGKRKRTIKARRVRHRQECLGRIERLHDELDAVDELIRLVAQRAACPAVIEAELEREIDRRLWELDEVDAAMEQLTA